VIEIFAESKDDEMEFSQKPGKTKAFYISWLILFVVKFQE